MSSEAGRKKEGDNPTSSLSGQGGDKKCDHLIIPLNPPSKGETVFLPRGMSTEAGRIKEGDLLNSIFTAEGRIETASEQNKNTTCQVIIPNK